MVRIANLLACAICAVVVAAACVALAAGPAEAGPGSTSDRANVLHVNVVGLRSSSGKVGCTLYNSPDGFPGGHDKEFKDLDVPIKDKAAKCSFVAIPAGRYALVVIHDENGNGKFDRGLFGIPKEGYAFSNNVRPRFKAPSFKAAAFDYKGGAKSLTIAMIYGIL